MALSIVKACGRPLTMRLPGGVRIWVREDPASRLLLPYLIGKYEHQTTRVFLSCLDRLQRGERVIDIGANVGYYAIEEND